MKFYKNLSKGHVSRWSRATAQSGPGLSLVMKFFLVVFIVACLVNVALSANVSGLVGYNGVHALPGVVAQPESRISRLLPSFYYMMTMVVSIKSHLDGVSAANILQQHPHITVDVQNELFRFALATLLF